MESSFDKTTAHGGSIFILYTLNVFGALDKAITSKILSTDQNTL